MTTNTNVTTKLEFHYGSIVSISGCDMDDSRWSVRNDALTFFGCVTNPTMYTCADASNMNSDESYVTFIVSGEYEWYDQQKA